MSRNLRHRGRGQQHRMPDQEGLDLSKLHPLAQDASHISVEQLTKSEQVEPWDGQRQDNIFFQPLAASAWQHDMSARPYARTEPLQTGNAAFVMTRIPSQNPSDADSGYVSQPVSIAAEQFNIDNFTYKPECLVGTAYWEYGISSVATWPPPPQTIVSDTAALSKAPRDSRKPSLTRCQQCGRVPKNHSDAKKHAETHFKRWKCEAAGCTRKEGFATLNDLERHRKSVHSLRPSVGSLFGYVCQACVQAPEGRDRKFWPRRDNFKAHIRRRHRDRDETYLLEVSRTQRPDDATTADVEERSVVSFVEFSQEITPSDPVEAAWCHAQPPDDAHHQSHHHDVFSSWFPETGVQEDSLAAMGSHAVDIDTQHQHPDWPISIGRLDEHLHQQLRFDTLTPSQYYMVPAQHPIDQLHADHATVTDSQQWPPSQNNSQLRRMSPHAIPALSHKRPPQQVQPSASNHQCPYCHKPNKRECDLKKHIKRHTRPYGCTFSLCNKTFGSRNDWKRHELTQHQRPPKRQRRGPEAGITTSFWCGFCKEFLVAQALWGSDSENHLALRRMDKTISSVVTEARIQHVGDHYDRDNRAVGEWLSLEDSVKGKRDVEDEFGSDGVILGGDNVVCKRGHGNSAVGDVSVWRPAQRSVRGPDIDYKFKDDEQLPGREDEEHMDAEGMRDRDDD
ncbi:hypothetical protein CERZMDRAFT_106186 [Cercospora zeae-maydis SCOH1-5]|uniref:C2H2-type domain-containing protein n=1 Tax=Cercospora zeae-maydis SCOH1-5 TaxID=717836 RepID=A0A6A6FGD6_9PEZI|nr:hypothetical protein CERZMDRAFT_106186 [Cercospora zeae-maydis SCOH1-5]